MIIVRNLFIFLQFAVLFLLFNPFLLTPFSFALDTYDLQRILQWILIGLSLLHLGVDRPVRLHAFGFLQSLCLYKKVFLALIFIVGFISSLHAAHPAYALMDLATYYGLFLTVLLFTGLFCIGGKAYLNYFYAFILLTFAVSCGTALLMLFYDVTLPSFHLVSGDAVYTFLASPGYMNRRFYDDVACMALPILIGLAYQTENKKIQINWLIFLLLSYMYTRGIISHSRIYIFEPLCLLMLFPFLYRRKALPFLGIQFAAILVGAIFYMILYMHHQIIPASFPDRTFFNNRYLLWSIALSLMWHHPFLGVGPLHFNFYAQSLETYAAHPHSAIMVIGSEWGLLVLAAVIILTVTGGISCIKNRNLIPMALMGSLVGVFLMANVDGLIVMPAGQSMLCLILGWVCAAQSHGSTAITQRVLPRWLSPSLLVLGGLSFLFMIMVNMMIVSFMDQVVMGMLTQCKADCALSPNYWSEGFISYYSGQINSN